MEKISLLSCASQSFWELASLTYPNHLAYGLKYGYDVFLLKRNLHKFWYGERQECQLAVLKESNWVHFTGADTLYTNFDLSIEEVIDDDYEFIIAKDFVPGRPNFINNDSFFIKNCPNSFAFLEAVYSLRKKGIDNDQAAMHLILENNTTLKVKYEDQWRINGYCNSLYGRPETKEAGNWFMNDSLIVHFPGLPYKTRIQLAKKFLGLEAIDVPLIIGEKSTALI